MSPRVRAWAPAIGWMAMLFIVSSFHHVPSPHIDNFDKVEHGTAYAVLGFLIERAWTLSGGRGRGWLIPFVAGSLYGVSDEIHQVFVPGRSADPRDWIADSAGVLLGIFIYTRLAARRTARASAPAGGGTLP
ncbi:MAG TPA: VanZ family protein [Longimicrobiaceae bacterium]|nr:VanZ family protein [Longimicrobiaceae bacterium]